MKRNPLHLLVLALVWSMIHVIASADEIKPADSPCPTLTSSDITTPAQEHRVRLVFPALLDLDPASLGDADLILLGADGFEERAKFEGSARAFLPVPLALTSLPSDAELRLIPPPSPVIVATYSFNGPGENWDTEDNGIYRVRLVEDAITNNDGRPFQSKFLGGFRCAIDTVDPPTIQPTDTRIVFHRELVDGEVRYFSDVILIFATPHVRIVQGNLEQNDNRYTAPISAFRLPIALPEEPVTETTADRVASIDTSAPEPFPYHHRITLTYRLGALKAGTYALAAHVNGEPEGSNSFTVPTVPPVDEEAPEAELAARNIIETSQQAHQFSVTYSDPSGIDIRTLGDGDVMVLSPCIGHPRLLNDPCPSNWKAQRARLVNVIPLDRRLQKVRVIYEVEPPNRAWTAAANGFYPIVWRSDEVCDTLGNCNREQRLGGFEVAIDDTDPPIKAAAEIRVDASDSSNVVAKVHLRFARPHTIVSQNIRHDENRIYLIAQAEPNFLADPIEPFLTTQENLLYEIGPLRSGEYFAGFIMNGHLYDHETFEIVPVPPIDASVNLQVDSSDRENVTARVEVFFNSPHRLVQGEVVRDGHRLKLLAKAEPLPISQDSNIRPPIPAPVVLEYSLGELLPGGHLAAFVMNDFPYATGSFVIEDPGPPIKADVHLAINQEEPDNTTGLVRIEFATPHLITGQDIHRIGNRFIFSATARPLEDASNLRLAQFVTLRFPLGDLPAGDYSAAFVMNGYPYDTATWIEPEEEFRAHVDLVVDQNDDGQWIAKATIDFANPQVRITDPGQVVQNGAVLMINATAAITDALDVPGPYQFTYELGELSPGPKWLKFFINDTQQEQVDFLVPAIPARVDLSFQTETQPSSAKVKVQFRDHYRITNQRVIRIGNLIALIAEAEGPLPILAPLPPAPIELAYDLGDLEPGTYLGGFVMNGQLYAFEQFEVAQNTLEVEVKLTASVEETVTVTAELDFKDPFVIVTDQGTPRIVGNTIHINATAARVDFFAPPSGDPQVIDYDLGELRPGRYLVLYSINENFEARATFAVPEVCEPLPHLADISSGEDEGQWFSKVALALTPGQQVLDWGTVRQSDNEFHVNITVACVDSLILPVPVDDVPPHEVPDGLILDPDGLVRMGGSTVRLVSHTYPLGELAAGHYKFIVHSRDTTLGADPFEVEGAPPRVELSIENITEAIGEHRFGISFHDRTGLNHESIQEAQVWIVGPDNFREEATLLSYASTDDDPSTSGFARYSVNGPDSSWDRSDNGSYRVFIEAGKVRDLQGNALEEPLLGEFHVRILAEPDPGVTVSFSRTEEGHWLANVEILSRPGEQIVVDAWGPLVIHGHSFVALATVHTEAVNGPVEPLAHSYDLGPLQPGYYAFVFKTNLAHCGIGDFIVPGVEGSPFDRWKALTGSLPGDSNRLAHYFFASRTPTLRAELVGDDRNNRHLGIRYRRLTGAGGITQRVQASRDLAQWDDVTDSVDLVERTLEIDGTETVLICLRQSTSESPYRYLRIALEADE
ncbi:hypothetical protein V2O64_08985 [Verrucomicrobiaceae bacterium 227]